MENLLFPIFLLGTLILAGFALSLITFLIIQKKREKTHILEKKTMELEHANDMMNSRLEVQEQSMSLISEELHDHVGQLLNFLKTNLATLKGSKMDNASEQTLVRSNQILDGALNVVRNISHSLNSSLIKDKGLITSVQQIVDQLGNHKFKAELNIEGGPFDFPQEENLLIFRIIQESVQNVVKHADASYLLITLAFQEDQLMLKIEDNGRGFNVTETIENSTSLGMRNIQNRARLLHAKLDLTSSPGKGTTLIMYIPKPSATLDEKTSRS